MPASVITAKLLLLAAVLLGVGVITLAATVTAMALVLLRPERMHDAKALLHLRRLSPSDLDLPYESVYFHVRDSRTGQPLKLTAWWIPAPEDSPPGRTVVALHGYTDAKVGSIAWAPLFRSLGFNVLAIDLRAHGESEGKFTTAGYFEREDIAQVIDQLRGRQPAQTRQVVLFGVSLGAAVAAAVAVGRDDLAAVVLECPYYDFPHALLSHARRLGVPGRTFQQAALRLCQWIAGIDYSQVRPVDLIPRIPAPLWVVQSCDDPFVPPPDRQAIAKAVQDRGRADGGLWQIASAYHIMGMAAEPTEYRRRLGDFLNPIFSFQSGRATEAATETAPARG